MKKKNYSIWLAVCGSAMAGMLAGCQSGAREGGFEDVQSEVSGRTGYSVRWDARGKDDAVALRAVEALLAGKLTADGAAQIALLNNHHLQATFAELGIARADWVQAGLLKNPVIDVGVRFPDRSPLGTYLDIGALEDVLDIVLLPARKKLAEAQYQEAKARIVAEVLETAAQARMDFVSCQAAAQMLALEEMDAKAAQAAMVAARQIRAAGNMDDLTFAQERENEAMADIELADARATEAQAREKENDELGLSDGQLNWTAAPMPQLPAEESLPANLETAAVEHRPAIAAAQREIVAQARMLGLTADLRFFSSAEIGPEFERETDGQWRIGPSISVPVPLFDLGDAKVSRAQASLREAEERCVALIVDVRSQVRAARREMLDARAKAVLYRDELIPIENDLLRQTELRYNGMLAGVFQLLSARRQQVEAQANYIGALRDYWIGRIDLERAIGGRIESAGAK